MSRLCGNVLAVGKCLAKRGRGLGPCRGLPASSVPRESLFEILSFKWVLGSVSAEVSAFLCLLLVSWINCPPWSLLLWGFRQHFHSLNKSWERDQVLQYVICISFCKIKRATFCCRSSLLKLNLLQWALWSIFLLIPEQPPGSVCTKCKTPEKHARLMLQLVDYCLW